MKPTKGAFVIGLVFTTTSFAMDFDRHQGFEDAAPPQAPYRPLTREDLEALGCEEDPRVTERLYKLSKKDENAPVPDNLNERLDYFLNAGGMPIAPGGRPLGQQRDEDLRPPTPREREMQFQDRLREQIAELQKKLAELEEQAKQQQQQPLRQSLYLNKLSPLLLEHLNRSKSEMELRSGFKMMEKIERNEFDSYIDKLRRRNKLRGSKLELQLYNSELEFQKVPEFESLKRLREEMKRHSERLEEQRFDSSLFEKSSLENPAGLMTVGVMGVRDYGSDDPEFNELMQQLEQRQLKLKQLSPGLLESLRARKSFSSDDMAGDDMAEGKEKESVLPADPERKALDEQMEQIRRDIQMLEDCLRPDVLA
ncbi:MAG TPA: hypothetical protein VM901_10695 [Bdellovibrionota bacterium]|nr:hypothetical protein [Bdellovibrionota bacterium]